MKYHKEPTKGKSLRTLFRRNGYRVYLIDEFRTSKICYGCHSGENSTFISKIHPKPSKAREGIKIEIHGVLRCNNVNCKKVKNRDFNSSRNMLYITNSVISGLGRPDPFRRGSESIEPSVLT